MATTRASARKSRAASGQIVPANKTAKDNPRHFDRTNNDSPEMPPRWSTPEKWKALEIQIAAGSTRHHAAWSHRTSVVLMTHPRKTYGRPALKIGGNDCSFTYRRGSAISSRFADRMGKARAGDKHLLS